MKNNRINEESEPATNNRVTVEEALMCDGILMEMSQPLLGTWD